MISSMSAVAVTPSGGRSTSSPRSLPAFSALQAKQPTNSRSDCARTARTAARATRPVVHWTTRIVTDVPFPLLGHELGEAVVEPPGVAVAMESVAVTPDKHHRPARLTTDEEHDVARRARLR